MDPVLACALFLACCASQVVRGRLLGEQYDLGVAGQLEARAELPPWPMRAHHALAAVGRTLVAPVHKISAWRRAQAEQYRRQAEEYTSRRHSSILVYAEMAFAGGKAAGCPAKRQGFQCARAPGHDEYHAAVVKSQMTDTGWTEFTWK